MKNETEQKVLRHAERLEATGRLGLLRDFRQHGGTTVYDHCLAVASLALRLARRLRVKIDEDSLIRGALLHDYFLYDWHVRDPERPLHGFYHPRAALKNASADFQLNKRERNIIRRHMFPLTLVPPTTKEGLLVCLADKLCALRETFSRR
jgi:uncharacterized protein